MLKDCKINDSLYRIDINKSPPELVTYTIIGEQYHLFEILPKGGGQTRLISKDSWFFYHKTTKLAWKHYLEYCKKQIEACEANIKNLEDQINYKKKEIERVERILKEVKI